MREQKERRWRKRNLTITGVSTTAGRTGWEIRKAIQEQTGITPWIRMWETWEDGVKLKLNSMKNKVAIMKNNNWRGGSFEIKDD